MLVEVASWNLAKGLGIDDRRVQILDGLKQLDADVFVLGEAFASDDSSSKDFVVDVSGQIHDFAVDNGYKAYIASYKDADPTRLGAPAGIEQYLAVLGRAVLTEATEVRLKTRQGFKLRIDDGNKGIVGIGAHFDDRSEGLRLGMVDAVLEAIKNTSQPTLVMGDFNAMHGRSLPARIMRNKLASLAAEHAPNERTAWLASRLIEMADGTTMQRLVEAGFQDADPRHRSTFKFSGLPFGQLDHIMTADLAVEDFKIRSFKGSDHEAIIAKLIS